MKKKLLVATMLTVMFAGVLSGCGDKKESTDKAADSKGQQQEGSTKEKGESEEGGSEEGGSEEGTLIFWNAALNDIDDSGTYAEDELAYNIALKKFKEQYPNVKIETVRYGVDEMNQLLTAASMSGDLPDIICTWAGSYTNNYKELLLNLEDYMSADEVEEYTGLDICREDMQPDGKLQALPESLTTYNIFYNKEVFKQAGIEEGYEPKTWEEFLNLCQTIKDKANVTPVSLVGDGSVETWIISEFFADELGPDELNKIGTGEIKLESGLFPEVYKEMKKMFDMGFVNEDYKSTDYNATSAAICNGQTAMVFGGSWGHSSTYDLMGDNVGTFKIPAYKADSAYGDYIISQPGVSLSVINTTDIPEAAVDFVQMFTSGEYQQVDCAQFGNISSNTTADLSIIENPLTKTSAEWIQNDKNLIGFDSLISAEAAAEFYKDTVVVNSDEMTAEELGKILDDIIAKGSKK